MGPYLVPAAIVFSALAAIFVANVGWWVNRKLARESAAFSLIVEKERENRPEYRAVTLLLLKNVDVSELAGHAPIGEAGATWEAALPEDCLSTKQKQNLHISRLLTFYEAVAIAIAEKIVDEEVVKRFLIQRLCWHIEDLYPFISSSRGKDAVGDEDTWLEVEELARRWGARLPEPPKRHKSWFEKLTHKAGKWLQNRFGALVERTAPRRRG